MKDVIEYINEKIDMEYPRTPRAIAVLRGVEDLDNKLVLFTKLAAQGIQVAFISRSTPVGTARATSLNINIGKTIYKHINPAEDFWREHLRLGCVFLEAFHNCGYVKWYRDEEQSKFDMSTPYTVEAAEKWGREIKDEPPLTSISLEVIPDITDLYQANKMPIIKTWMPHQRRDFQALLDKPFVKGLNTIQQTGWRVNKDVHYALMSNRELFIKSLELNDLTLPSEYTEEDIKNARQKAIAKNREFNCVMSMSEELRDESDFYYYVDCDWRGRIYYTQKNFHYQGSDAARGQLEFSEGKPLDGNGKWWLAVHTANSFNAEFTLETLYDEHGNYWWVEDYPAQLEREGLEAISVDKMSLEDRVNWVRMNMDTLIQLGRDGKFDMTAEKPVAFLACCFEWFKLSEHEKWTDEPYICHLPVAVDGSCNGAQNLAGMSKDDQAGGLVGLSPRDIPKDFYLEVGKSMLELKPEWFAERDMPMKVIRKAIAKRGSMTTFYGSGASKQAENMWSDVVKDEYDYKYNISEDDCKMLAKLIKPAIKRICPGPITLMKYFQELAAYELGDFTNTGTQEEPNWVLLRGNGADYLEWVSPSGFPVKYERYRSRRDECITQSLLMNDEGELEFRKIKHRANICTNRPDKRGYASGIAANWTHSCDAAHLMLTIQDWDTSFAAIHDSFSVHPSEMDNLIEQIKYSFHDMYEGDFIDYITNSIVSDTTNLDIEAPEYGDLDLTSVYDSDYFFA